MLSLHRKTPIKSIFGIALMSAALGLTACSAPLDPDVKARQDIMKDYGDAMGIIGDMVKAPDTFDAELLKDQTSFLAEASQNPWAHFENQEAIGNATEAVWSDNASFVAESEKFQQVTAELNNFKEVGASCKSCHTDFKVKTD